jgi:hypothetical protein
MSQKAILSLFTEKSHLIISKLQMSNLLRGDFLGIPLILLKIVRLMNNTGKYRMYLYLLFIMLIFWTSCKEKNMEDAIVIDPSQAKSVVLSEIVDSISYIELETKDECLIGYINRIKYYDGHYYIYDHGAKTIYIFDETGKFVKKFNKYGQGAGEYLVINSFAKDNNGLLHIHDMSLFRILIYDTMGNFISKIDLDGNDYPRDFICFGDKYMLYMPDKNIEARQGAFIFDPKTNTYTEIMHIDEWENKDVLMNTWNITGGNEFGYSLIDGYSDAVYNMKYNEVINKFKFDIQPRYNHKSDEGYQFAWCSETDDVLMIYWIYCKGKIIDHEIYSFFNKNTKALKIYKEIERKRGEPKVINDNIILFTISGETDDTGFELNPWLQIWHLKDVDKMP